LERPGRSTAIELNVDMMEGKTLEEAATKALANPRRCDCVTKDVIY
jgi:hypothetical protein